MSAVHRSSFLFEAYLMIPVLTCFLVGGIGLEHYITYELNLRNVIGFVCVMFGASLFWFATIAFFGREMLPRDENPFFRKAFHYLAPFEACTHGGVASAFMLAFLAFQVWWSGENTLLIEVIAEIFLLASIIAFKQAKGYFPS